MIEVSYGLMAVFLFAAFLLGIAVCYVFGFSKLSMEVSQAHQHLLDVYENTQELLDDTKHIQDKLDRNAKSINLEQAIGIALMDDNWEIDTVFDDISGRTTAFEPETDLPMDSSFVIELDEATEYTVVVPKRVLNTIRRVLRIRESQQKVSALPYSTRAYLADTQRPITAAPLDGLSLINPLLTAAAQQHMEKKS